MGDHSPRMNPNAYWYMLPASVAGGIVGLLVMWSRKRTQIDRENGPRRLAVLAVGTAASACALWAFTKAFGGQSCMYAAMVTIVVTAWAAVLQPVAAPLVPKWVLRVRTGEVAFLGAPWTGVRQFGAFLRTTPLRHLGGRVYLSEADRDPMVVLRGIRDAEVVHLGGLLLCCPWLVIWGTHGWWRSIVCSLAVHVPLNVYPVLHLRYVTWRIDRYLARTGRRQGRV
jgi:hypothetical protein